jgi:hypothetical protein
MNIEPANDDDVKTMMRFYQVETERHLIAALNAHVESLAKKLPLTC